MSIQVGRAKYLKSTTVAELALEKRNERFPQNYLNPYFSLSSSPLSVCLFPPTPLLFSLLSLFLFP